MTCPAHSLAASRGMLTQEDVDAIGKLVDELPTDRDVTVIDLGLGSGTTALAVFAKRTSRIHVYSVDNRPNEAYWGALAVENIGQKDNHSVLIGDSRGVEDAPGNIDLLLVDAINTAEGVKEELRAWLPLVRGGGFIWVNNWTEIFDAVESLSDVQGDTVGRGWVGRKSTTHPPQLDDGPPQITNYESPEGEDQEDRPPCSRCGFEPPAHKNYKRSMTSHKRTCKA